MTDQIRIVSNGTGPGTKVYLGSTTTEVGHIRELTVYIGADDVARADLVINIPISEIVAAVGDVTIACPVCEHEDSHTCKPIEHRTLGGK